ncbi:hypothetical protein AAUPMC_02284, partial [Pasteurella multocida subsp. multocida str. Anand1_cattle]
ALQRVKKPRMRKNGNKSSAPIANVQLRSLGMTLNGKGNFLVFP